MGRGFTAGQKYQKRVVFCHGAFFPCLSRAIRHFSDYNRKKLIPTIGPRGDPLKICWYCVFTAIAHESAMGDLCTYSRAFRGYTIQKLEKRCFMYCDPPGPGQVTRIRIQASWYSFVCAGPNPIFDTFKFYSIWLLNLCSKMLLYVNLRVGGLRGSKIAKTLCFYVLFVCISMFIPFSWP